jgi:hypothetical protein
MPFFRTVNLRVMTPAISMAPQKDISPSPSAEESTVGLRETRSETDGRNAGHHN